MGQRDTQEFIIMLLIENRCLINSSDRDLYEYIYSNYDIKAFNRRYRELLDDFLKPYALNKTEKSEEHD